MTTHRLKMLTLSGAACLLAALLTACTADDQSAQDTETTPMTDEMAADSIPSLQAALDERKAQFMERADSATIVLFEQGVRDVAAAEVMQTALRAGDTAPMFTLPDGNGDSVALSDLLADGPVVLMWYRGGWCPYCNMQLNAMQEVLPYFDDANATLVAISPEIPDSAMSTQEANELDFVVLSDVGNVAAKQFGVGYELPQELGERFKDRLGAYNTEPYATQLPLAVTYIIDTDSSITWAFIDPDYRKRAEPAQVVEEIRKLAWE